jgi:hypothetical protein
MTLWGLLEDGAALTKAMSRALNKNNHMLCMEHCFSCSSAIPSPRSSSFYPLAKLCFDINASVMFQSFPITDAVHKSNMSIQVIVLQVTSNWGSDLTCLYHLGIHGEA